MTCPYTSPTHPYCVHPKCSLQCSHTSQLVVSPSMDLQEQFPVAFTDLSARLNHSQTSHEGCGGADHTGLDEEVVLWDLQHLQNTLNTASWDGGHVCTTRMDAPAVGWAAGGSGTRTTAHTVRWLLVYSSSRWGPLGQ